MFFDPGFYFIFGSFQNGKVRELLREFVTGNSIGVEHLGEVSDDFTIELEGFTHLTVVVNLLATELDRSHAFGDATSEQSEVLVAVGLQATEMSM